LPDANGCASVQITPVGNNASETARDLVLGLLPGFFTMDGDALGGVSLPEDVMEYRDGVLIREERVGVGLVKYVNPADQSLLDQGLVLGGSGAVIVPGFLPVATERLREAIRQGQLPEGSDRVTFRLRGRPGFVASLAAGLPQFDLGPGVQIESLERVGDEVVGTASTDPVVFDQDSNLYQQRFISATLGNGAPLNLSVRFVGYRVEPQSVDHNLPLNAAYSFSQRLPFAGAPEGWFTHDRGAVPLRIAPATFGVAMRMVDLELRPSLHACWDVNRNGLADPEEDLDGDGLHTEVDIGEGAVPYLGAWPDQPLIGFTREANPITGELEVRTFRRSVGNGAGFYVYGNVRDRLWLDRRQGVFRSHLAPDGLPDFVSTAPNAESLVVGMEGGNLADYFTFTAYNVIASVEEDLPEVTVGFDDIRENVVSAYSAYGTFDPSLSVQGAALAPRSRMPVAVHVDHEARPDEFHEEVDDALMGFVPGVFRAGVLDQYFQRGVTGGGFGNVSQPYGLGRDGRVHAYRRLGPGGGPTQQGRLGFGMELDGVLYDAISFNSVKRPAWAMLPGFSDAYLAYLAAQLVLTNRLDEPPNSEVLRLLPVARRVLGAATNLTAQGLVAGVGGTSGGWLDRTRHTPGRFQVDARTPGADLPGLHAGYLIEGRPEHLVDPRTGVVEDDIRDVILKRNPQTRAMIEEERLLGLRQPRRVHGFAANEDFKEPIRTGLRVTSRYAIGSDPPGVTPSDPELWKIRAWIGLRMLPEDGIPGSHLSVTTQSDGHEKQLTVVVDTLVDVTVDVLASAILGVMTEGAYLGCGGVNLTDTALNAVINLSLGLMDREVRTPLTFINKTINTGWAYSDLNLGPLTLPIPGVRFPGLRKLEWNAPEIKFPPLEQRRTLPDYKVYKVPSYAMVPFCSILTQPVSALKTTLKGTYSAELFGGLGSAEAFGMKALSLCIPKEAQITNGLYSATFVASREMTIQPKEPDFRLLEDLPFERVFGTYPFADEMSDEDFLAILLEKVRFAATPGTREEAAALLNQLEGGSLMRRPRTPLYEPYKLRAGTLPEINALIGPGQILADKPFGDFVLTPGRTVIPVASTGVAIAGRSNENGGARATVTSPGHEMVLLNAVIRRPSRP
jgi:hypothetical protein